MAKKTLLSWLDGYERDVPDEEKSFISVDVSGSVTTGSNNRIYNGITLGIKRLVSLFGYTTLRAWGTFLLALGLMSVVLNLSVGYASGSGFDMSVVIVGAVVSIIGILLIPIDRPASLAFSEFAMTDYIFFEFFGLRRARKKEDAKGIPFAIFLLAGIALGTLSLAVPLWVIVAAIGVPVYLILAFSSPEFSFFVTFLALPYLSFLEDTPLVLSVLVVVGTLSFARKVFVGKRVYHIEQYDILILLFLLPVLISGIFKGGAESFRGSLMTVVFAMCYVLSSSLVTNRRLADRMAFTVVLSAVPMSVYVIVETVLTISHEGVKGFRGTSGSFAASGDLAAFLLIAGIFAVYIVASTSHTGVSLIYLGLFAVIQAALVCSFCVWAFVAQAIAVLAYGVLKLRKFSRVILIILCLAPYSIMFLPESWFSFLGGVPMSSGAGIGEFFAEWQISLRMFADNLIIGIGVGSENFGMALGKYEVDTVFADSGSFLLGIGLESGIFALLLFAAIFAVLLRHRANYRHYVKHSSVKNFAIFSMVVLVTLIVFGAFECLWDDPVTGYLFWCTLGGCTSALRISKRDFDEGLGYFSDVRSSDSSEVDIDIE